ncbi:MFS general substrate transporter [Aspergillus sclerotioniger CBS 115572]|uniref:MFS general substrate transporter n=1 Tax=Aspergillus sclerotioniger CBS 115572 TaxID=1450535 RepID=A0A317X4L1_9EURO|nr:MFS general substrate transporter [Aspergillus sclerotioniger CBS 115572]PWY93513.1 MFS general substrate transporter [Aspergillus sclerotioniger CBS 115572]
MSVLMLSLITIIVSWDATALSVALATITSQLQGTTFQSFRASIAFTLGVAVTQPIYASVSDALGLIFATACNINVVVVGRLIQGLGGGGLDVLETIILTDITTLKERPRYQGVMSVSIASGVIGGPLVGGVFAEYVNWRWLGWINLPFVGSAAVLSILFLRLQSIDMDFKTKVRRLDWVGFLLFTIGATAVALPLSWAGSLYPWGSWRTLVPLVIGCLVLVVFAILERKAIEPMIPYRIFDNRTAIVSAAIFLQAPLDAAKPILPFCLLLVALSIITSVVIDWTRRYRLAFWLGWILTTVFLGLLYRAGRDTSQAELNTFQVFLGSGIGIILTAGTVAMLASVTRVDDAGLAVGLLLVFRILGSLLGLAIASTVFSSVFQKSIAAVGDLPESLSILQDASRAIDFIPELRTLNLPDDMMDRLIDAYQKPFQMIWLVLACIAALASFISFFVKDLTLEKEEVGRQGFQSSS